MANLMELAPDFKPAGVELARFQVNERRVATIRDVVTTNLPRPRSFGSVSHSPDFSWVTHKVWELLHSPEGSCPENACADPEESQDVAEKITASAVL